jgi:uracil-DNA glycosylase
MNNIHESWKELFLKHNIDLEDIYDGSNVVYPNKENVFKVFEMDVIDIKILLLGQDPYHNPNQAIGLSFSVGGDVTIPPSLQNIFKELKNEFPERKYVFENGNLERWFYEEKIFLLNSSLTVVKNRPASHMELWENFTNDVIKFIDDNNNNCIFVLLGNYAKSKKIFIKNKHNIIEGVHPSPFSANKGFFNSNIFIEIENKLGKEINWNL